MQDKILARHILCDMTEVSYQPPRLTMKRVPRRSLRVIHDQVEPIAGSAMSAFSRLRSSLVLQQNFAMCTEAD
jgi:hypothetical protein